MNSLNLFFVVAICFVYKASAEDKNVTITFSATPMTFILGTPFVAKCSIDNLDATKISNFTVNFNFSPSNIRTRIARYKGRMRRGKQIQSAFTDFPIDAQYELVANKTDNSTFPDFEVLLNPRKHKALGKYYCSVNIKTSTTDVNGTNYISNVLDLNWSSPSASAEIIPSLMVFAFAIAIKFI